MCFFFQNVLGPVDFAQTQVTTLSFLQAIHYIFWIPTPSIINNLPWCLIFFQYFLFCLASALLKWPYQWWLLHLSPSTYLRRLGQILLAARIRQHGLGSDIFVVYADRDCFSPPLHIDQRIAEGSASFFHSGTQANGDAAIWALLIITLGTENWTQSLKSFSPDIKALHVCLYSIDQNTSYSCVQLQGRKGVHFAMCSEKMNWNIVE